MKYILNLFFLILAPVYTFCQNEISKDEKFWLPEKYVHQITQQHTTSDLQFRKPIEGIAFNGEQVYLTTFASETVPVKHIATKDNKILLLDVQKSFNRMYINDKKYDNAKFYLSRLPSGDKVLVEIAQEKKTDSIFFIKSYAGYEFEFPYTAFRKIMLLGNYQFKDAEGSQSNITFGPNGSISGDSRFTNYEVTRVNLPDEKDTTYEIVTFKEKPGNASRQLALRYDEKAHIWYAHDYKVGKDKYRIIAGKVVFELKRL